MKILYLCNLKDNNVPDKDILFSLKKKGEVKVHDSKMMDMKKVGKDASEADLLLFHGDIGNEDIGMQFLIIERMKLILQMCTGKKVLWFLDKVWGNKVSLMIELYSSVDYIFVNDETWLKRFKTDKIFPLHCASSEKRYAGKVTPELVCDVALIGNVYGERENEIGLIKERFGSRVKIFNDKFGKDFASVCKSAKVIVDYNFPFDDYYWSDNVYKVLSNGGVFITQRKQGLKDEGFVESKHYFDYFKEQELVALITSLLDKRGKKLLKQVSQEGKEFIKGITYSHRIDTILNKIQNAQTTNISVSN
jgi:hypothetical protein